LIGRQADRHTYRKAGRQAADRQRDGQMHGSSEINASNVLHMTQCLLYSGYRVFPGGKVRPGRDADPSPPSSTVVMKE